MKYWRQKASGLCCTLTMGWVEQERLKNETALKASQQVKFDLISCGFTPNQKSVWIPTQELFWLGNVLNFREATIAVTQKILKLKQDISFAVSFNPISTGLFCLVVALGGVFHPPSITPLSLKLDCSKFVRRYFQIG